MNCPKCNGGILGFQGGLLKCVDCSWTGQSPKVPESIWKPSTKGYIETLTDEQCTSVSSIADVIGTTYLMSDVEPPEPKVLEAFIKECIEERKAGVVGVGDVVKPTVGL